MQEFELEIFDGHAIFRHAADIILIDTGAPKSIRNESNFEFLGMSFRCLQQLGGATIQTVSRQIGKDITLLMGNDILEKFTVLFDYSGKRVLFDSSLLAYHADLGEPEGMVEIKIAYDNYVTLEAMINGKNVNMFLDTGARIGYLDRTITAGIEPARQVEDHYPMLGRFQTEVRSFPTALPGGLVFNAEYGTLPQNIESMFFNGNRKGILGYDFFNKYTVHLNLRERLMKASPADNNKHLDLI